MSVLARWMQVHDRFDAALMALRRLALEGQRDKTLAALTALDDDLTLHMRQEEGTLMPVYEELATGVPPNAAPHVFRADHDRIRDLVSRVRRFAGATARPDVVAEQEALSLLAGVLEHHDHREHRWFVPLLDAEVPAATRAMWVEGFEAETPPPAPLPTPEPAPTVSFTGPPMEVLVATIGRDGDVAGAFAAIEVPAGRPGQRLYTSCEHHLESARAAPSLPARRDALVRLLDRVRLLAIVATHAGSAE